MKLVIEFFFQILYTISNNEKVGEMENDGQNFSGQWERFTIKFL